MLIWFITQASLLFKAGMPTSHSPTHHILVAPQIWWFKNQYTKQASPGGSDDKKYACNAGDTGYKYLLIFVKFLFCQEDTS